MKLMTETIDSLHIVMMDIFLESLEVTRDLTGRSNIGLFVE